MNRPELYQKTINVLLDAYNNGELSHGVCSCCAVGNICKESSNELGISNDMWSFLFVTSCDEGFYKPTKSIFSTCSKIEQALILIKDTGYTVEELTKIEWAFETAIPIEKREYYTKLKTKEGQYMGLCAVLEVLKQIHEKEEIVEAKERLDAIYSNFNLVEV